MVTLPQGTQLQDYKILRVLGAGGFGITYLAEDMSLHKKFAIKEYFPQSWANRDASDSVTLTANTGAQGDYKWGLDRFLEEARTLAKFRHPAIVDVNAIIEANNTAYMVLDYEEGMDFRHWLEQLGRTPTQAELDAVLEPLLEALALIHKNGILHRDIAPDNIYIRSDGTPVLLDFGAAREAFGQRTKTLSAIVKSGYSPQEQYSTAGRDQGPWTDIYALGATLYRAVTGEAPPESVQRSLEDTYVPAREKAKGDYRASFLAAIDKALQLHPSARPQAIAEWRPGLLGEEEPVETRKKEVPIHFKPPKGEPKPPVHGGGPLKWVALASLLGALIAGGGYYLTVAQPDRSQQQEQALILDNRAWEEAERDGTIAGYRRYLDDHENGRHAAEAREKIAALQKKEPPPGRDPDRTGDGRDRDDLVANLSPACKRGLDDWRTKSSFGAYAAEKRGGCGWSWGYKTENEAREAALKECHKQGPDCTVIEVHRTNKGDFTLSDACQRDLEDWNKRPGAKVFAAERRGGCGWSYGYQTLAEAQDRALDECRKQGPDCKVLHTGENEKKPQPGHDPDRTGDGRDRDNLVANLSPACKRGLDDWRTKSSFGAFAAEQQGGCGWSWGYATENEAREAALRECRKHGPSCTVVELHRTNKGDFTLSDACRRDLDDWRKRPGRKAFAAERRGGCGWSYGYQTLAEARNRALAECRKQGPDCKLLHTQ